MSIFNKKLIFSLIIPVFALLPADKVVDWASITSTPVQKIVKPTCINEIQDVVREATLKKQKVSIWGAGYSQGGQTAYKDGIVVDMRKFNSILKLDVFNKKITVRAGATWKQIIEHIDPYNLSIQSMQSYYNFSVGGSLSVNVHGRQGTSSQLISTVESIKIILADGSLITASRQENYDIFRAAIGGYGYMGIIVEATLNLTENVKIYREVRLIDVKDYKKFFEENIQNRPDIVLHNGNLYPNQFNEVLSIAWKKTDEPLTTRDRFRDPEKLYFAELVGLQILRRVSKAREWRAGLEPKVLNNTQVAMRNFVMAEDTKSLEPLIAFPTSHILQEYFIPCDQFDNFVDELRKIINYYNVNVLNCSIRYVKKNSESLLSYAQQDSFSFVLYINILNMQYGKDATQQWTQELIDQAIKCGGSFYLPYLLSARKDQLLSAYPNFQEFLNTKKKYDPNGIFSNELFRKYFE